MKFSERNDLISDMVNDLKSLHDTYTSSTKLLKDNEWADYIHGMDAVCEEYKGTNLADISWKLCQSFLDDTAILQKKLKELTR